MLVEHKRPNWFYEALPYLYVAAGVLTILSLRNTLALGSGLILIATGIGTWLLRLRHRQALAARAALAAHPPVALPTQHSPPSPTLLVWKNEYETGHPAIDAQHRRLFGLANELMKSVARGKSKADLHFLLDELSEQIVDHCCSEDALLAKTHHRLSAAHQTSHREVLARLHELSARHERDEMDASEMAHIVAHDLIAHHLINEDSQFANRRKAATAT